MSTDGVTDFPLKRLLGLVISDTGQQGQVQGVIEITPDHLNPNGVVHGAVLFALLDTSMGAATMRVLDTGSHCATVDIQTRFIRPAVSGRLVATATVIRRGRHLVHLEATAQDDLGQLVAMATATFAVIAPS